MKAGSSTRRFPNLNAFLHAWKKQGEWAHLDGGIGEAMAIPRVEGHAQGPHGGVHRGAAAAAREL
nr:unnamed protein product [Digitaria exilis]